MNGEDESTQAQAIKKFRAFLNTYKHKFNEVTLTSDDMQDTAVAFAVLKLIDELYDRVHRILQQFKQGAPPHRPTQDTPFEYTLFKDGHVEYLYVDVSAVDEYLRYLKADLKEFPFTYNTEIVDSYGDSQTPSIEIVSNTSEASAKVK